MIRGFYETEPRTRDSIFPSCLKPKEPRFSEVCTVSLLSLCISQPLTISQHLAALHVH